MTFLAYLSALIACAGVAQGAIGYALVRRFRAAARAAGPARPPVTVLKPLAGAEPLLEEALVRLCLQDYGPMQIVCGVQDPLDPAITVVRRVQATFPRRDLVLVVDSTLHGRNRKIANLINMFPAARHDIIVMADSDVHAAPDYLARVVDALAQPGVGLATTLYAGRPAFESLVAMLGASSITHVFLPGALLGRALGRQDTLGATMALRRETLEAVGGLPALADHLADDHMLGELVRSRGLSVRIASTVPSTTVPETSFAALFRHELRWSRTVQKVVPVQFALSSVQYPLAWAMLTIAASGFQEWSVAVYLAVWAARAAIGRGIDVALALVKPGLAAAAPVWLLPLRDLMSVTVMLASYLSDEVEWRGATLRAEPPPRPLAAGLARLETMELGTERS